MALVDFLKTSLIDYPGKVASVAYVGGCNFRCPYCHNGDLVLRAHRMPALHEEVVIGHLKKREGLIEGLVLTGGEATLWPSLFSFLERVREETSVAIKLDTNGSQPQVLERLLRAGLVDMVAMDIKHRPQRLHEAVGPRAVNLEALEASMALLKAFEGDVRFRTTLVRSLHKEEDVVAMARWIEKGTWVLQQYRHSDKEITPGDKGAYHKIQMESMAQRIEDTYRSLQVEVLANH